MALTDDDTIEKYARQCKHGSRNFLLHYEFEWTCVSCG